jgi:asparagine synthase (glutamine-hydrolysing)
MQRSQRWAGDSGNWELQFTRLAIVDLSDSGSQPMSNEDGSLVMIFNGEIYNSPELRGRCERAGHHFSSSMDGEVILHLWEMEGAGALARLNGIFAVAIASSVTGEVFIARDPLGVKPLFYATSADTLWFGSEIRALMSAGAPAGLHDVVALAQFLTFLWIPDPRTPYIGIRSVEPGHALHWSSGGIRQFRYCAPLVPAEEPLLISSDAALRDAEGRVATAVQRQLLSDVPIGLMASGGIDSSLLWQGAGAGIERAFTIGWLDNSGSEGLWQDAATVRDLERTFGTPVEYIEPDAVPEELAASGDLFADPAYGLTRMIARAASALGYKVLLSGQGGDELFAGYRRHRVVPLLAHAHLGRVGLILEKMLIHHGGDRLEVEYLARVARALAETDPMRQYMQLCSYSTSRDRARALGCTEQEVSDNVVWQRHADVWDSLPKSISPLRRAMALDLNVYLPGLGLAYVDRAGMEFGVEIRVPWLDLDLVRWSLTLPDRALMRRGRGKWIPREIVASRIARSVANRPKRGFAAPLEHVRRGSRGEGTRGFRQAHYFARATRLLSLFLGDDQRSTHAPRQHNLH